MKKILVICYLLSAICYLLPAGAADEKLISCGEGYIIVAKGTTDGISTFECQKLWCQDLENGKTMGTGNNPVAGYRATTGPEPGLMDSKGNHIACFGDRKWCAKETPGFGKPPKKSPMRSPVLERKTKAPINSAMS